MAIIKWDPLGNIMTLQDRINQLFDDSFPRRIDESDATSVCAWTPDVDIFETDQGLVVAVDLPGVDKEDVMVEVRNNVLTISGDRVTDPMGQSVNHYRRERQWRGLSARVYDACRDFTGTDQGHVQERCLVHQNPQPGTRCFQANRYRYRISQRSTRITLIYLF